MLGPPVSRYSARIEVNKLTRAEREKVIRWAAEDCIGRLPLTVTITGPSVDAQRDLARFAIEQGAAWLIFQPPPLSPGESPRPEAFYFDFFARVMEDIEVPVGIQNAPDLGVGLTPASLRALATRRCFRTFVCSRARGRRSRLPTR